jgi:hypothetical protein
MRRLLDEISDIPGVSGSCIFDKIDGALCSDFNVGMPRDLTEKVGIHFVRLMQMGTMNKLNIKSAHYRFDRYSVVGMPLHTGAILLTICDSQANCSLVATTAAMLAADMREEMEKPASSGQDVASRDTAPRGDSAPGNNGDVQKCFDEIENALAAAIGPVAGMVMSDYVSRWKQSGPASASRLPELITMLVEEIGDAGLSEEFQAQIRHLM